MSGSGAGEQGLRGGGASCGKLILLGEHFVVHGVPALALPLPEVVTRVEVAWPGGAGVPGIALVSDATDQVRQVAEELVCRALARLGLPAGGWRVQVRSSNPVGFGLGSSAAFAVALLRALASATGRSLSEAELDAHALALEQVVHGSPSGIDNTVAAHCRPVWFARGAAPRFIDPPARPRLVLARSSHSGSTREAVARVAARARRDAAAFTALCAQAEQVTAAGVDRLLCGDWPALGALMDRSHALLQQLEVSTAELDRLIAAARGAGALGAKLTGAGLGGFAVALVSGGTECAVRGALVAAGAAQVILDGAG